MVGVDQPVPAQPPEGPPVRGLHGLGAVDEAVQRDTLERSQIHPDILPARHPGQVGKSTRRAAVGIPPDVHAAICAATRTASVSFAATNATRDVRVAVRPAFTSSWAAVSTSTT
ncbi:hypothetical protein [Pseudonocardia sp. NPDC049635]|uniref:hypothetical protein n=1 Tax=Pseudonocardia sp. NPDC049635 TaxID=3155506 RepID=UPI003402BBC4